MLERLGRYRWEAGDPRAAVEATEQGPEAARSGTSVCLAGPGPGRARLWRMLLGEPAEAMPLATQAVALASRSAPTRSTRTAWRYSASSGRSAASSRPGWRRWTPRSSSRTAPATSRASSGRRPTTCTCSTRPAGPPRRSTRPAPAGQAARSLDAPAALTSVLDNNTAAVLTATGRWAKAGQLLAELIGESRANVTRYLQLLQLELAVGRGEREQRGGTGHVARGIRPRIRGSSGPCTPASPSKR